MGNNMEILGIIPARGGSKGIPHKNIAPLAGKPLLAYSIDSAHKSKRLTRVIVSTDDEKIARVAKKYGAQVPFLRPKSLAHDATPAAPVILHVLSELKKARYAPDVVVFLQPTSPLRRSSHIDEAVDILIKTKADTVVSVTEVPHQFLPGSVMRLFGGKLLPFLSKAPVLLRRQDKPKLFARNGPAVLVLRTKSFLRSKDFYSGNVRPFFMNARDSVDIDAPLDLKLAEFFLKNAL